MTAELTPYRCDERHAREITEQIRTQGEKFFQLLMRSYEWEAWRALGYESWRAYAMAEFGIGKSRAYELLDQARVIKAIEGVGGVSGIPEINAGQAEALKPILKDHGPEAAAEVLAAASENGKPTAAAIRQVAEDTGKARVTTTTRTSEATKVEQVVDTATGEIVEDAARRAPIPDEATQRLRDYIANDPDIRAANLRKRLSSFIARIHEPLPDPVEMATIAPERAEDVAAAAQIVADFAEKYRAALPKPTHLRAVRES